MMTPTEIYQQDLKKEGFSYDEAQAAIVDELQRLYDELISKPPKFNVLQQLLKRSQQAPKGIYIWGSVGRGKTYLVDTFYNCLPFNDKIRLHYHRFMKRIHDELKRFKGEKDPLSFVAKRLAKEARIIVLDEFFVLDIADAMILGRLLKFLFDDNVVLVTTSNIYPDGLYKDGLQRDRFLPAIELIKEYTVVLDVEGDTDYRLRTLEQVPIYYTPLSQATTESIQQSFNRLVRRHPVQEAPALEIEGRNIPAIRTAGDVAWFSFYALCDGPRSQNDYIVLSREFHTIFLDKTPIMHAPDDDMMRRFINLIDEFYDRSVNLIIAAEAPMDKIYQGTKLTFEYKRTLSRLQEMQSKEYLASEHCP